jgi:hypothetical protein
MMHSAKLTPEDKENIYTWAAEGVGYTEIVNRLENKISKQRIEQLCRRKGLNPKAKRDSVQQSNEKQWLLNYLSKFFEGQAVVVDQDTLNEMIYRYKIKARSPNFQVEFHEIEWHIVCPVLGIELNYFNTERMQDNSPTFDRIDSSKGYVPGNVCVISWKANRIKNDGSAEEHRLVSNYMFKRGAK